MPETLSFISIVPWTLVMQIINVFILYKIVKKLLFDRVQKVLSGRKEEVDGLYTKAEEAKTEALAMHDAYSKEVKEASRQAKRIVEDAERTASITKETAVKEAEQEIAQKKQLMQAQIAWEKKKATQEARKEISNISIEIAKKVVERDVDEAEHEAFIASFIDNLEAV